MTWNPTELAARLQPTICRLGPVGMQALGYRYVEIDNNPRHGLLAFDIDLKSVMVEVVERCGQWWALPTLTHRAI